MKIEEYITIKKPDLQKTVGRLIHMNADILTATARYAQDVADILTSNKKEDNVPLTFTEDVSCEETTACPNQTPED